MKKIFLIITLIITPLHLYSQDVGKNAPLFSGKTLSGETINLADYKGKVTILDFWASWCKPCKEEFPFLIDLYNKDSGKNFSVLTVNVDEESENIKKFTDKLDKEVPFKIIYDKDKKIVELYITESFPSAFIIDKNGVVRFTHIGFVSGDEEKYNSEIEKLINE